MFLERSGYTQRRLVDAARLLPFLGLLLWLLPLVWPRGEGADSIGTAAAGIYIFGVWAMLIALGAVLSWWIGPAADAQLSDPDAAPDLPSVEPFEQAETWGS